MYAHIHHHTGITVNIMRSPEQCITMTKEEFCLATGLGLTTIYTMMKEGRLSYIREGRRVLIVVQSYLDLIAKQQETGVPSYDRTANAVAARMANRAAHKAAKHAARAEASNATLEEVGL
jgi:excisionase family DNA binding protein